MKSSPQRGQSPVSFEILEKRALFSQILVSAHGAVPNDNRDDRIAVQAAINAAKSGDTVAFGNGFYNFNAWLTMKTGVNVTSVTPRGAMLDFNVSRDGNGYGFRGVGVSNIAVTNLKIRSNNGIFRIDNTNNLTFTGNDLQWGYNGVYYNRLAFTGAQHVGLKIEGNYFHDSPMSDRNVELWNMSNSSYSYNSFNDVNDGGHIMNPGDNVRYSFNYGRMIHRMGIEVQQTAYPPSHWPVNFVVEGNVFYDWNKPYWDSMGLSVPLAGINVTIKNNYLRQNAYKGIWGEADSSGIVRGSYGIEGPQGPAGQPGGIIEGNTIVSERSVMAIAAPGKDTIVRNNKLFGNFAWGKVGGEPGSLGWGNAIETNTTHTLDLSKTPPSPPIEIIGDGFIGRMPIPEPTPWPNPNPSPIPNPTHMPSPTQPWDESRFVYLTRYAWTSARNGTGAGPIEVNMTNGGIAGADGRMLSLSDNDYEYGLGVAGSSEIVYQLHGQFAKFTADVGVDDESGNRAALQFQVWGDGRLLFDSGTVRRKDAAKSINIDTTGVQELKLITTSVTTKGSNADPHGDWADARLFIDPMARPIDEA